MIKAKKHFGQNFLQDKSVIKKIIQAIPKDTENIVEIGPGLGDLTQELVKKARVRAYEIDKDLIDLLQKKFAQNIANKDFELIFGDVLDFFGHGLFNTNYFLCANLPYYVATNIILNALRDEFCDGILVMIQKEVAQRFSGDDFCQLSVLAGCICECKIIANVPPSCFNPPPKVDSQVIFLKKHKNYKEIFQNDENFNCFCNFLKKAFSSPRKKLLSNLKNFKSIKETFKLLNIDENIRPHELSVELFLEIFKRINDGK